MRGFPRGGSPVTHPRQADPTRAPRQSPEPAAPGGRADAAKRQAQRLEAEPVLQQEPTASSRHGDPAGNRRRAKAGEKGVLPQATPTDAGSLPPGVRTSRAGVEAGPFDDTACPPRCISRSGNFRGLAFAHARPRERCAAGEQLRAFSTCVGPAGLVSPHVMAPQ